MKEGYTRISQILAQWNHLAHVDPHVLENKCRIGIEVHEKISAEIEGIYIETKEDTQGYIDSWIRWIRPIKDKIKYLAIEKRFYCEELNITGCVDAIIESEDKKIIVDYKTSASANKKMWALQASFYHYLALKNNEEVDPFVFFVHLKKDGRKANLIEFNCTEGLWEVAKSALRTYRYFND